MGKFWFTGMSSKTRKEKMAREILALIPNQPISFSNLARKAEELKISRATLSKHLKRLVSMGIVERHVDGSTYPPTVFYRLKGELDMILPFEKVREGVRSLIGKIPKKSASEDLDTKIAKSLFLIFEDCLAIEAMHAIRAALAGSATDDEGVVKQEIKKRIEILKNDFEDYCLKLFESTKNNKESSLELLAFLIIESTDLLEEALKILDLPISKVKQIILEMEKAEKRDTLPHQN